MAENTPPTWRTAGLRFQSFNHYCRQRFGFPVGKVSLDARLGCPHRGDDPGKTGCIFCLPESFSPARRRPPQSIVEQVGDEVRRQLARGRRNHFLAYFQPDTNTHGPVARLRAFYEEALANPHIVGLAVGTRPDCVSDDVLDLLAEFTQRTWLTVEYGIQSMHDRSLAWLRRGHDFAAVTDAVARSRQRGIEVGAHVILGIPGESRGDMQATARAIAALGLRSVKLHNLYAVHGTPLGEMATRGEVPFLSLEQYAQCAVDFVERLPCECVIDRLAGDAPPQYLAGPAWCGDKSRVRAAIDAEFVRRDTWQGKLV
jgi:uncharacterized protein